MHIVYLIIFTERLKNNIFPCYYIGSKSNGKVINNVILDKNNKEYIGSATYKDYKEIYYENSKEIYCLYESIEYRDCINAEKYFHLLYDVVADIKFFNKGIASINNFSHPGYGTYRHSILTNEYRKLPINHPLVENKTWIGVTKDRIIPDIEKPKHGRSGELNGFYGRKHKQETIDNNKIKYQEWLTNNPEYNLVLSKRASKTFKGKPKSDEQKTKMSESGKGYVTLKHKITKVCIRIKRNSEEYNMLNLDEWSTPYMLRDRVLIKCPYCNKEAMSSNTFLRWHFENCRNKEIINEN